MSTAAKQRDEGFALDMKISVPVLHFWSFFGLGLVLSQGNICAVIQKSLAPREGQIWRLHPQP